jgi:hypothetical protein
LANIPFGNYKITELGAATLPTDAAQYQQIQSGATNYLTAVAGTDTITANLSSPTLTAYAAGNTFRFTAAGTNTGATTVNINGLGAKTINKDGYALMAGDITSGRTYALIYDGTNFNLFSGVKVNNGSNILINAGFRINNGNAGTPYVSAAVLASGEYGHEMWKAGASGGDYSFTQLNTNTQITIASGKSLIQVVEDKNVNDTSYVLSWEGTAQARVGVDSATPSGTYASSPILITGQTAGTTMSVEFNTGTLGKAQLEKGTIATPFENQTYDKVLAATQRYYWKGTVIIETSSTITGFTYPVTLRATPTITGGGAGFTTSATTNTGLWAYQSARASQNITSNARL